jgi:hypothetical protein
MIVTFGNVTYQTPPSMGSMTYSSNILSYLNPIANPGGKGISLIYFPQALFTNVIKFSDIVYTADARYGQSQPNYNDNHVISFEMELFGCDNYQMDAGDQ